MDAPATYPLRFKEISGPVELPKNAHPAISRLKESDPALAVMTDFTTSAMFSVNHNFQIDQAMEYMKAVGVRLLFVLDDDGGLCGLVTTTDIQGGRPTRYMHAMNGAVTRNDVLVKHVMSHVENWVVLDYHDVRKTDLAQVVSALKSAGMRHLVVIETGASGTAVRGVISATRVEQALGIRLESIPTARTFAEIEHAVAGS